MKPKIAFAARLLLGLIYFVFGLNGFLNFIKMTPPPMPEAAMAFVGGLMKSGYFMPFMGGTQVLGGFLLLTGLRAPLALVILAPMTLNIVLFHVYFTPQLPNLVLPSVMMALHVLAATAYWNIYRPLFSRG